MKHAVAIRPWLGLLLAGLFAFGMFAALALTPGCALFRAKSLPDFEAIPQAEFDAAMADTHLLVKVAAKRLIADGKCDPVLVENVAATLAFAATDPLVLGGPNVVTDALKKAGFTDEEILLTIRMAEAALRQNFNLGAIGSPLGPHARLLLQTISAALHEAVAAPVEHGSTESR